MAPIAIGIMSAGLAGPVTTTGLGGVEYPVGGAGQAGAALGVFDPPCKPRTSSVSSLFRTVAPRAFTCAAIAAIRRRFWSISLLILGSFGLDPNTRKTPAHGQRQLRFATPKSPRQAALSMATHNDG